MWFLLAFRVGQSRTGVIVRSRSFQEVQGRWPRSATVVLCATPGAFWRSVAQAQDTVRVGPNAAGAS